MAGVPNFAETYINALSAGRQQRKQQAQDQAFQMVGSDPEGAQNALLQAGDYQGAAAVGQIGAQQRELATRAKVAPMVASGDYQNAARTAAAGGQYDVAGELGKLDDAQRARASQSAELIARAAHGLTQLPPEQRADGLQKLAPMLAQQGIKPEQLQNIDLSDQGLQAIASQALTVKDQVDNARADATQAETVRAHQVSEKQAASNAAESARHNKADEHASMVRAAGEGWQVMLDKDGTPFRINSRTGQAVTVNGGQPYEPQSMVKPGSNNPRSAAAMAVKAFVDANPNATPDDIMQFNSKLRAQAKATGDFATGQQGKTLNSLNVAVSHLDTLQQAADALHNGDIPLFNKIAKDVQVATGKAAPTNFDATKQIVADEVVKAVVGAGGGQGDREKAQAILNRANSPAQLSGAIGEVKHLMAGQLDGLRLQYKSTTGQNDFENRLLPATKAELEGYAARSAAATGANSGQGWKVIKVH